MLLTKQYYGYYRSVSRWMDRKVFTIKEETAYVLSAILWMAWSGFLCFQVFDPRQQITTTLSLVLGGMAGLVPVFVAVYHLVSPIGKVRLKELGLPAPDLHWCSDALLMRKIFVFMATANLWDRELLAALLSAGEHELKMMEDKAKKMNEVNLKLLTFFILALIGIMEPAHLSLFFVYANIGLLTFVSFLFLSMNWIYQTEFIAPFARYVDALRVIQAGPSVVNFRRTI